MSQKVEKVHNFLDPLPQDVLDFFEFGKNLKFDADLEIILAFLGTLD